jgi:hypothetical protein
LARPLNAVASVGLFNKTGGNLRATSVGFARAPTIETATTLRTQIATFDQ